MSTTKRELAFYDIPGFPGLRKAEYRATESGEDLLILELRPNVFHIVSANHPETAGETVLVKDVSKKKGEVDVGSLIGLLLDYLTTPPKDCYSITIITQWPNGHTQIESERHCD